MTDLELDVWDAWLRERQEHLEETLSNISPSEEPCRYYLLTGYIQGMLEALTMLTTVEDGKRFKIKLEQFRQNLLLSFFKDCLHILADFVTLSFCHMFPKQL